MEAVIHEAANCAADSESGIQDKEERKKSDVCENTGVCFSSNSNHAMFEKLLTQSPVDISFQNIVYHAALGFRKGRKKILHNLNGRFPPGQLIGIMGPSGAGKSILLDILSGYRKTGVDGTVLVNGVERDLRCFRKMSCYIMQDDRLQPLLTVEENMLIAADLKLPAAISREEKMKIIQQILEILRLTECVQTMISELSGGQKKRLSIALELINNPLVMFLDEPTTGLDGVSCNQCLRLLQQLARQGRTIICSIHQPSASMFQVFDQVYVIANGNCLYQGSPANIVQFFEDVGAACPVYHNPADYVIEVACGEYGEEVVHKMLQLMEKGKSLKYVNGAELLPELNVLKERTIEESNNDDDENLQVTSQWNQLKVLLKRSWYKMKRDRTLTYMRIFTNIFIGIMLGIIFWEIGDDASRIKDNYNLLISVMMHHMSPMMLLILTFPTEMSILIKEHFNRWYSLKMYFISVTLVDIPLSVLCCIIFTSEVYYMSGQPLEPVRFAMFFPICVLIVLIVQSFGLMVGALFDVVSGNFVGPAIAIPTMMFAGFPIRVRDLPNWLYWGCYVSYLRYGLEAMAAAIYGMQRGKLKCPEDADFCIIAAPADFLDDMGIRGDQFWVDVGALILFVIVFKILAYVLLRRKIMKLR